VCFNIAHYFVNTLLPRSSFCYRISRTPAEEASQSYEDYLQKWPQSPWKLHRGHNQIKLPVSL